MTAGVQFGKLIVRQRLPSSDPFVECFTAEQEGLGRAVELRLLRAGVENGSAEHVRFLLEIKAFTTLEHHNVLKTIDAGTLGNRLYYVVNYRSSATFDTIVKDGLRTFDPEEVMHIGRALASALEHIHQAGFLHMDVGPSSISFVWDGEFPFFNTFRNGANTSAVPIVPPHVPDTARVRHTPEGQRGLPVDQRTDVYLLCAFMYWLATGTSPFSDSYYDLDESGETKLVPVDPTLIEPSIPRHMHRVLLQGLARDPADRFQSAGELRRTLEKARRRLVIQEEVNKSAIMSASSIRIDPELLAEMRRRKEAKKKARRARQEAGDATAPPSAGAADTSIVQHVRDTVAAHPIAGSIPLVMFGLMITLFMFSGNGPTPSPPRQPREARVRDASTRERPSGTMSSRSENDQGEASSNQSSPSSPTVGARADAVREMFHQIRRTSTSSETFETRWRTLQGWLQSVPPAERDANNLSYASFIRIRIDHATNPDAACLALDELYRRAHDYLEQE